MFHFVFETRFPVAQSGLDLSITKDDFEPLSQSIRGRLLQMATVRLSSKSCLPCGSVALLWQRSWPHDRLGPLNHAFWWPCVPAMALSVGKVRLKHQSRTHGDPWGQKLPLSATLDDVRMLVNRHTPPVPCTPRVQRDFLQPHPR